MANDNLVVKTRKINHFEREAKLEWGNPFFTEADAQFLRRLSRTRFLRCAEGTDSRDDLIYIPRTRRLPEACMPSYALARLLGFARPFELTTLDFENEGQIFDMANRSGIFDLNFYDQTMSAHRQQISTREKAIKDVSEKETNALIDWLNENFKIRWHIRN